MAAMRCDVEPGRRRSGRRAAAAPRCRRRAQDPAAAGATAAREGCLEAVFCSGRGVFVSFSSVRVVFEAVLITASGV